LARAVASSRLAHAAFLAVRAGDPRQRLGAEIDDVGGVGPHPQRLHQLGVVAHERRPRPQEAADGLVAGPFMRVGAQQVGQSASPPIMRAARSAGPSVTEQIKTPLALTPACGGLGKRQIGPRGARRGDKTRR
jgi:hypothetical protein